MSNLSPSAHHGTRAGHTSSQHPQAASTGSRPARMLNDPLSATGLPSAHPASPSLPSHNPTALTYGSHHQALSMHSTQLELPHPPPASQVKDWQPSPSPTPTMFADSSPSSSGCSTPTPTRRAPSQASRQSNQAGHGHHPHDVEASHPKDKSTKVRPVYPDVLQRDAVAMTHVLESLSRRMDQSEERAERSEERMRNWMESWDRKAVEAEERRLESIRSFMDACNQRADRAEERMHEQFQSFREAHMVCRRHGSTSFI